jgi:hypothetical protein
VIVMNLSHVARALTRGPASMSSPAARWAVSILALAGATLLVWSSVIHLQLWSDGYRSISVIGPLFLIQGIGGIVLALAVVALRRVALLASGALLLAGTAVGLLVSSATGLFGFQESLAVPYATTSLAVEFTGAAIFLVATVAVLTSRPRAAVLTSASAPVQSLSGRRP